MRFCRAVVLAVAVLWSSIAFAGPSEEQFRRQLPGRWQFSHSSDGVTIKGISSYSKDGHATFEGTITAGGQVIPLRFEGDWTVRGDKFSIRVTQSTVPDMIPVGSVETDMIIAIDETSYTYLDSLGTRTTEARMATP